MSMDFSDKKKRTILMIDDVALNHVTARDVLVVNQIVELDAFFVQKEENVKRLADG